MLKWIAPLFISIKKACGFGESFQCPCCGKKIYFCGPEKKDTVKQIILGRFITSIKETASVDNAFEELFEALDKFDEHNNTIKETDSLYGQAVANERK